METAAFGQSVIGATHLKKGIECQDSNKIKRFSKGIIFAIADGHGSKECPYSKTGSKIAVNVFCDIMEKLYFDNNENIEKLGMYLCKDQGTIPKGIALEWQKRIRRNHLGNKRGSTTQIDYRLYGTTLIGGIITDAFYYFFQLGDGDIILVEQIKKIKVSRVIETEKILGIETNSLCSKTPWKQAKTKFSGFSLENYSSVAFLISTDGFSNSFTNESEFFKSSEEYLQILNQYGPKTVEHNLKDWLTETSQMGCGDDVSMVIAYFCR